MGGPKSFSRTDPESAFIMKKVYEEVGQKAVGTDDCISLEKNLHLLQDEVGYIIKQVLWKHPLTFPLLDFQKLALHQIGSLNKLFRTT